MEGGQKQKISLESAIDIKSSDMLVPVSEPLFQHNRQRFQGKTLPSSVRFEHDGWAAGDCVYHFNFESSEQDLGFGLFMSAKKYNDDVGVILNLYTKAQDDQRIDIGYIILNKSNYAYNFYDYDTIGLDTITFETPLPNNEKRLVTIDIKNKTASIEGNDTELVYNVEDENFMHIIISYLATMYKKDFYFYFPTDIMDSDYSIMQLRSIADNEYDYSDINDNHIAYNKENNTLYLNGETLPFEIENNEVHADFLRPYNQKAIGQMSIDTTVPLFYSLDCKSDNDADTSIWYGQYQGKINPDETEVINDHTFIKLNLTGSRMISKDSTLPFEILLSTYFNHTIQYNENITDISSDGKYLGQKNDISFYLMPSNNAAIALTDLHLQIDDKTGPEEKTKFHYHSAAMSLPTASGVKDFPETTFDIELPTVLVRNNSVTIKARYAYSTFDPDNPIIYNVPNDKYSYSFEPGDYSITNGNCSITFDWSTKQFVLRINGRIPKKADKFFYEENVIATGTLSMNGTFWTTSNDLLFNKNIDLNYLKDLTVSVSTIKTTDAKISNITFGLTFKSDVTLLGLLKDKASGHINVATFSLPNNLLVQGSFVECNAATEITFQLTNSLNNNLEHPFILDGSMKALVNNITASIPPMNYTLNNTNISGVQHIIINGFNAPITLDYNVDGTFTYNDPGAYALYNFVKVFETCNFESTSNLQINLSANLEYNLYFKPFILNHDIPYVESLKDNTYFIQFEDNNFEITKELIKYKPHGDNPVYYNVEKVSELLYHSLINYAYHNDYNIKLMGVYRTKDIDLISDTLEVITFKHNNNIFRIAYNQIDTKAMLTYLYTPVEEKELKNYEFMKVNASNLYQFVKQQWNTTSFVENYWWINENIILELTESHFILKQKIPSLSDWNGDNFEILGQTNRHNILNTNTIAYGVSNANNVSYALWYQIDIDDTNSFAYLKFGLLNSEFIMDTLISIPLRLNKVDIGNNLNDDNTMLNTYSEIMLITLLTQAKYSACHIKGNDATFFIFGIHLDNNFNQWSLVYNMDTDDWYIIQGYGFVGADGSLTGGEVPKAYFDVTKGFNSKVEDLAILKADPKEISSSVEDIYKIDIGNRVVGNENQQWYINPNITGIVSHLIWNPNLNKYDIASLDITNNLSQVYGSASFVSKRLADFLPTCKFFTDIFPSDDMDDTARVFVNIFTGILALAFNPMIFMIAPRIGTWIELQQTLGQYAYVHYNSTSIHQTKNLTEDTDNQNDVDSDQKNLTPDPNKSDAIIFNKHIVTQSSNIIGAFDNLLGFFASYFLGDSSFQTKDLKVNTHQNQTSTSASGSTYSAFSLANMDTLASTDTTINGQSSSVTSKVTGVLSLDMFYSTCADQKVYAGRGYVNHNFVAQCTAQSVTAHHMENSQINAMLLIKDVTLSAIKGIIDAESATAEALTDAADSTKEGSAFGSNFGWVAAVALNATAGVLIAHVKILSTVFDTLNNILTALGGDKLQVNKPNGKSIHTIDLEGLHKYGSKTECFMWPCFGIEKNLSMRNEYVSAKLTNVPWHMNVELRTNRLSPTVGIGAVTLNGLTTHNTSDSTWRLWEGDVNYFIANVQRAETSGFIELPNDMAFVAGVDGFLSDTPYRNENIGESEPVFATPPFQDYIIDKRWKLSQTASVGMTTWVSCDDTKIIDGEYSNTFITDNFCGIACPYTAIEIKRGVSRDYLRPYAITPQALALNHSSYNCCFNHKAYHAFDGYGYRLTNWVGAPGMNKEHMTWLYCFLKNDRFKRSNKLPHNTFLGNFVSEPEVAIKGDLNDKVFTLMTQPSEKKGLTAGTIGEDKDVRRYAAPVFSEHVSALPAVIKTISAFILTPVDGITSLTSENRDLQTAYKAPISIDFTLGKTMYRFTQEYICLLNQEKGITTVEELVPCLGLSFLGSTPYEAYFYSKATRQYYSFTGGTSIKVIDMLERFRDINYGKYDFINQEVIMPCLSTFTRLDNNVYDDADELDNSFVARIKDNKIIGEVTPPIDTICNTRSWFKVESLPIGLTYQGPNRCIVNRFIAQDYMFNQIKENYGKWKKVPREKYNPFRKYKAIYTLPNKDIGDLIEVKGWTHNPFLLVTAPLGVDSETDCQFEWEITFAWPIEMDSLYANDNYAVVNIQAQTMTPGGKVIAERPTHVFLTKELFTRTGNYGYYSFRYQSNCGAGNRERLHIWSDQYIAISSLQCEYKVQTSKRNEILTQQVDISGLREI